MEEIKEYFKEIEGLEQQALSYDKYKKELEVLASEIEKMKQELSEIDVVSVRNQTLELERKRAELEQEIEIYEVQQNECSSFEDLHSILEKVKDDRLCFEKCLSYLGNLLISYTIKREQLSDQIKRVVEEDYSRVIKINKTIESVLECTGRREFGLELRSEFKNRVDAELGMSVPMETAWLEDEKFIYVLCPLTNKQWNESVELPHIDNSVSITSADKIINSYGITADSILHLLKNHLFDRVVTDELGIVDIEENNKTLRNSQYAIPHPEEYLMDVIMKTLKKETRERISSDKVVDAGSGKESRYISKPFSIIKKCLKMFEKAQSTRKERARKSLETSILLFFTTNYSSAEENFILYSDLTHFLALKIAISKMDILTQQKEDLVIKVIDLSTKFSLDLSQTNLMLKVQVKQIHFEFSEMLDKFIRPKMIHFVTIQFFSNLYGNFISFVIRAKTYTSEEKVKLAEVAQYLLDLSFEEDCDLISNYYKVTSVLQILRSNISEVRKIYEDGNIKLDKYELKMFIKMIFDNTPERNEFLQTIH